MVYPVEYVVEICDEYTGWQSEIKCGVTLAENFTEAMSIIENYYGEDSLNSVVHLTLLEESDLYEFNTDPTDNMKEAIREAL